MKKEKLRVLLELRACLEGFSGIPMETRLVFRSLHNLDNIIPTGLINHPSKYLSRGLSKGLFGSTLKPHRAISRLSRMAISVKENPVPTYLGKFWETVEKRVNGQLTRAGAFLGRKIKLYDFDASDFGDFIWQAFFSNTLPASDFDAIRIARYTNIRPSMVVLQYIAIRRWQSFLKWWPLPRVNTRDYDIFISQTPWPARISPNTQLVVRYHDAIPVFLPHTVEKPAFYQAIHMAGLEACRERAIFACDSQASRMDLLKIYPELERRSLVLPVIVSKQYYEEEANPGYVINTIRRHICSITEPKFLTSREKERFYERKLGSTPPRFLLQVSSIDLRKNHSKLIAAWDYLKNHGMPDLKLIVVGELGWEYDRIVASMSSALETGDLFHLTKVPFGQLRVLYRAAAAVVCPSVAEGFDLSGIEAMLCGSAVLASDIPVHREVYGNACEYFNPYSALDLAKALERVITPECADRRAELIEAGLRHGPQYRSENVEPMWRELFERIRLGEFKPSERMTLPVARTLTLEQNLTPEHLVTERNGQQAEPHFVERK